MAIPISYNLRSLVQRWSSTIVAIIGIAGTVGVFVAVLALANGFRATLVASGSPQNALIRRAGSTSELESAVNISDVKIMEDEPGVARDKDGTLISPEVVVVAAFPMKSTGTDGNAQVRGVSPRVLSVRNNVSIKAGRFFQPGLNELVIGRNIAESYSGFDLGKTVKFGGGTWTVVGVFDSGGSAFDSEIWCDGNSLNAVYKRPVGVFQSVTIHMDSLDSYNKFRDAVTTDPRLNVSVEREIDYYEKESRVMSTLIRVLGTMVAMVMAIGAILGALNTMYSAVSERGREVATMRALGFGSGSVIASFVFESLCIAAAGGIVGCLAVLPINGLTVGTMNFQTFSHLAFDFQITTRLMLFGMIFALFMGLVGGVPPAIRAARSQIATALREL